MANIKNHIHGILGSLGFLLFVTLLLLLLGFTTPLPLPQEECVVIDFTDSRSQDSKTEIKHEVLDSKRTSDPTEKILSEINSDNPYIPGKNITERDIDPNENRLNNLFDNAFNNNNSNNSNNSINSNNNPGINGNNNGPESGYGTLQSNRNCVRVDPTTKDNMFGVVILKITVDEKGKVIDVSLVNTTCDQCVKAATDAVKKWQYEPLNGSGYQVGNVTLDFRQE